MGTPTPTRSVQPEQLAELGLPNRNSVEIIDRRARSAFNKVEPEVDAVPIHAIDVLRDSARVLEQLRVIAALAETAELLEIASFDQLRLQSLEVMRRVELIVRMDPLSPFLDDPEFLKFIQQPHPQPTVGEVFPIRPTPSFLRAVSSLVEKCPIEELERIGVGIGQPDLGHRCRISYDWLRAFLRRHTRQGKTTLHILGRAYAEGRLSLGEAAHLLVMPRHDAVAWLEEHGYVRDLSVVALSQEQRQQKYATILADRQRRDGKLETNACAVTREVIATQRIEGVDARPWLPA